MCSVSVCSGLVNYGRFLLLFIVIQVCALLFVLLFCVSVNFWLISVGFELIVYARFGAVRVWLIMVVFLLFIVIQMQALLFLYCDFVCRRLYQDYRFVYCFFLCRDVVSMCLFFMILCAGFVLVWR